MKLLEQVRSLLGSQRPPASVADLEAAIEAAKAEARAAAARREQLAADRAEALVTGTDQDVDRIEGRLRAAEREVERAEAVLEPLGRRLEEARSREQAQGEVGLLTEARTLAAEYDELLDRVDEAFRVAAPALVRLKQVHHEIETIRRRLEGSDLRTDVPDPNGDRRPRNRPLFELAVLPPVDQDSPTFDPVRGFVPFERPLRFEPSPPPEAFRGARLLDAEGNELPEPGRRRSA